MKKSKWISLLLAAACSASAVSCSKDASSGDTMRDISTAQVVKEMGVGWNLGNTLEACGDWISSTSVESYETAWGNPVTTKEIIDGIAGAGARAHVQDAAVDGALIEYRLGRFRCFRRLGGAFDLLRKAQTDPAAGGELAPRGAVGTGRLRDDVHGGAVSERRAHGERGAGAVAHVEHIRGDRDLIADGRFRFGRRLRRFGDRAAEAGRAVV